MKDPVVTFKHFVLLFNNIDYKIRTHSQDLSLAILQSHFADASPDNVVIETVSAASFQTLDCEELTEDSHNEVEQLEEVEDFKMDFRSIFTRNFRYYLFYNGDYYPRSGFKNFVGVANSTNELINLLNGECNVLDFAMQQTMQIVDTKRNKVFQVETDDSPKFDEDDIKAFLISKIKLLDEKW